MGQTGSFQIFGKSAKAANIYDEVDLQKFTRKSSDIIHERKVNHPGNDIVQKHEISLEKSGLDRKNRRRPTTPRQTDGERELWPLGEMKESTSHGQDNKPGTSKENYEKKIAVLEAEVQQLREEKDRLLGSSTESLDESGNLTNDYKRRIQSLKADVQQLKEEKNKLLTRLSEICAVRPTEIDSKMADLSDPNRPTQLVKQFSELYDNEWTDAFEYLSQTDCLEDAKTIRKLLNILQKIYRVCLESIRKPAEQLKEAILSYLGLSDEDIRQQLNNQLEGNLHDTLDKYTQKCTHVCWFMCIMDPQMHLDFVENQMDVTQGDDANDLSLRFDEAKFDSYTKEGIYMEFVVWPAVYVYKDGPLMKKGIAQGSNRKPEAK